MNEVKSDMKDLVDRMVKSFPSAFINLTPEEQKISLQIFRLLAKGKAVSIAEIATTLDMTEVFVDKTLHRWSGISTNDDNNIVGYWGLALSPTKHQFKLGNKSLYTWCAWDTLFIPGILGQTAYIESTCPVTEDKLQLVVGPDEIQKGHSANLVVSFITPDPNKLQEDMVANFCHYIHFFSSLDAGAEWVKKNAGTFLLTLEEAFFLGKKKNEIRYKDVLAN